MRLHILFGAVVMVFFTLIQCTTDDALYVSKQDIRQELNKLAPVEVDANLAGLSDADIKTLVKLLEAAKIIDELFLLQVNPENPQIREKLVNEKLNDHLALFDIMFGPWNRLEENKPFLDQKSKPLGAGFYPEDMTKEEFDNVIKSLPEKEDEFTSEFTIIRRKEGKLIAIPYHLAYKDQVDKISQLLKEAADLTNDNSLANFLNLRSEAFLTDDYFASDMAWMDLSGDLEIVISPYEVYEDALYNFKAAFEAFLCRVDFDESKKLEMVSHYLNEMESHLPIENQYKNFNRGSSSPIKVVNELFAAGDTKAGIQTTAFNLPNDERVREAKGSKKVMLKNIAQAKYEKCWIPIVNTILAPEPLAHVSFEAYFNHVLMHEMSHGLGPGTLRLKDGTETTVSKELKELYSTIEECKADVLGIYNLKFLIDKGVFNQKLEESMYASYLGGMFRSIRFGIDEAHGGGVAIQFNYLMEQGAFKQDDNGKLYYDKDKFMPALTELAHKVLLIEALGDYDGAQAFINKYRTLTPVMEKIIKELEHVPVDIRPTFTLGNKLSGMI